MSKINWKTTAFVAADIALAVYLLLAVSAFNNPEGQMDTCTDVDIVIEDGIVKGFLDEGAVRLQLQRQKLWPVGDPIGQVSVRRIEDALLKNPLVGSAECYKTHTGRVRIMLKQRLPVIRVMADNGDDYYVDHHGAIMPAGNYTSDQAIATGHINKTYAQQVLMRIGNMILNDPLWRSQIEQLHVLPDGSLEMVPRVGSHIVYLGRPTNIGHKLERLEKFYKYGLSQAGWNKYSYISLEFDNQIICKKVKNKKAI
ncbi:MAG: cell division protein FtsQ [Prevotella sp.]|nr:cell division protein FtsQ [Prevotella sp.]